MPLINELFQEAIRRCGEVSGEMQHAEETLERLLSRSQALGAAVASKSSDAHRHLQELTASLARAEHELEEDGRQAQSRLEDLGRRSSDLQGRVGGLLQAVQAGFAELSTRRVELEAQQKTRAESADADLDALGQRIHGLEAAIDAGLQEAGAALGSFRGALSQARAEWRQRLDDVNEGLDRAEEAAREQTRAYVSGIEGAFNDDIDALVDELPHDLLIEPHNQAVAGLMQKLTEEAKGQVVEALGPVRRAMEDLGQTCRGEQDRLQQSAGEILKKAEAALRRLERVRPAWALAHRLG